ncbi:MAG: ferredoxin [Patescibacteria group bacterium]
MTDAKKKIAKVVVNRDLCIGAGTCVVVAGKTFELDGENKAIITDMHGDADESIMIAAQSCPTQAIELFDEFGEKITQ